MTAQFTHAADGFARKAWTTAEVRRLIDLGVFDGDEPYELLEGELVAKMNKKNLHEIYKRGLMRFLVRTLPDDIAVAVEPTLYLSDTNNPEPDILIHADRLAPEDVRGPDVMLAIEIADSSLDKDLRLKARIYARHRVAHYWVVNANTRQIHAHRDPSENGYQHIEPVETETELRLPFAPEITIRLADFDRPDLA